MKRNRKGPKPQPTEIRVWTYEQTRQALPYLASVTGSLREHWLDMQRLHRDAQRLAKLPGRADRTRLLREEAINRQGSEAMERFHAAQEELNALDVFCTDPIRGEAVVPFVHNNELAWFLYDRFDEAEPIRFWRLHSDPLDLRRPIAEALPAPQVA